MLQPMQPPLNSIGLQMEPDGVHAESFLQYFNAN